MNGQDAPDDEDERTVIVGGEEAEAEEQTVIVGVVEPVEPEADPEADEQTVIVDVADADDDTDDDPDEQTVIVGAAEPEPDEHTIIVEDDDPTSLVELAPAAAEDAPELSALDEQSIRRVVRSRRLEREPLRPMPVPPGRHGPLLPGSGAGAIFTAEVRPVPAAAPEPVRPAPVTTLRAHVPSVAVASRRSALIALVTASASVLVSVIGLVWVVQAALGR